MLNTAPVITGTARQGETITISTAATWTGETVASVAYRCQRNAGAGWATIAGATASSYVLQAADVGATVRFQVEATGTNGLTSGWYSSNATGTVTAWLPILTGAAFAKDPINAGEVVALNLLFERLVPSVSQSVTVALASDPELTGPTSQAVTVVADASGHGAGAVSYTAASAGDATVTATLNGTSVGDTVSIAAALYDYTDLFDGTNGQILRTRPNWDVLPSGETAVSNALVLDGAGGLVWSSTTPVNAAVMVCQDAGASCQTVEAVVKALGGAGSQWLVLAASDSNNAVLFELVASGMNNKVYKRIAGVNTLLATIGAMGVTAGSTLRLDLDVNTSGGVEGMRVYVDGVNKSAASLTDLDWSGLVLGTKAGISAASRRGAFDALRVQGRAPVAALSDVALDRVEVFDADVTAVGAPRMLRVHATGLTPSATQTVALEVIAGSMTGDVCGVGQAVTKTVTATPQGAAWIDYQLTGAGVGEQTLQVRAKKQTATAVHNVATFAGFTLAATATQEDPLRVELSFAGLPPLVSHEIPVSITAPAGLAEFDLPSVLVKADALGNGVGVLGGFAAAAGTHTLSIASCGASYSQTVNVSALSLAGAQRLSDPATFGGSLPAPGAAVTLPTGVVLWDTTAAQGWASLVVPAGCKLVDDAAVAGLLLNPGWLRVDEGGMLLIGRAGAKRALAATISLTGATPTRTARTALPGQTVEGFIVTDPSRSLTGQGHIIIHGLEPEVPFIALGATSAAGSTSLTTAAPTGWPAEAEVIVTPSAYPSLGGTELHTLSGAASGTALALSGALARRAWGQLMYATDTGVSLTPGPFVTKRPSPRVQSVIDERARVALLTRPILINCPNDSHWSANGHGVTTISHNRDSAYWFSGVRIDRCGQRGVIEHYPWHAHFKTYGQTSHDFSLSDGSFLGDTAHTLFRGVVSNSMHRGTTIHATTGARVQRSVIYATKAHTVMLEEGSEHRYRFEDNLVATWTTPAAGDAILDSDKFKDAQDSGPSAFWLTTPQGICRNNVATDGFVGIWNALSRQIDPVVGTITGTATAAVLGSISRAAVAETWTFTATSTTVMSVSGSVSGAQAALTKGVAYDNGILAMAAMTGSWSVGQTKVVPIVAGYAGGCVGLSAPIADIPFFMPFVDQRDNLCMYNRMAGCLTGLNAVNDAGVVSAGRIDPRRNGLEAGLKQSARIHGMRTVGNERGGYSHQTSNPGYEGFAHSSWIRVGMFGGTSGADDGRADHLLWAGRTPRMSAAEIAMQQTQAVCCVASYHDTMAVAYSAAMDVPANPTPTLGIIGQRGLLEFGGFILVRDLYTESNPEHWFARWYGCTFANVPDTQLSPPGHIELDYTGNGGGQDVIHGGELPRYTLAGILNNNGQVLARSVPATHSLTYDHPFYNVGTTLLGKTKALASPARLGFRVRATDTQYEPSYGNREGIYFDRLNSSTGAVIGTWGLNNSNDPQASGLANFHFCAMLNGEHYAVYNGETGAINASRIGIELEYANSTERSAVVSLPWSGAVAPKVHVGALSLTTWAASTTALADGSAAAYTAAADLAACKATPRTYWADTVGNKLWVHFQGGYAKTPALPVRASEIYIGVTPA